jgi:hypothetical protein
MVGLRRHGTLRRWPNSGTQMATWQPRRAAPGVGEAVLEEGESFGGQGGVEALTSAPSEAPLSPSPES